jgi:hypothetical protein
MSKYLKITNDIIDLRESFSIDLVFVEITNHGKVLREIGVDSSGKIIHKYPSHSPVWSSWNIRPKYFRF